MSAPRFTVAAAAADGSESSGMTPDAVDPAVGEDAMPAVVGATSASVPGHQPSTSYSMTMRVRQRQRPGAFARAAGAIGGTGAILGAIDLVRAEGGEVVRDVTVACGTWATARPWRTPCAHVRRDQPGGHLGAAVL
jgi:hypothetical protein